MSEPKGYADFRARREGRLATGIEACRRVSVADKLAEASYEALREEHQGALRRLRAGELGPAIPEHDPRTPRSLLGLKRLMARRLLKPCRQCWLRCEVDRLGGERGLCLLGPELRVYNELLHWGEEQELSPTHAVFLSGCNFRCRFCSDWEHVVEPAADPVMAPGELARRIVSRHREGARTLSFIGGLPEVNLAGILDSLCELPVELGPPLVWNSNMTASWETEELLSGLVDLYLADLKFGNDGCARRLAGVEDHASLVLPRIERARDQAFVIVRHLVMPGHLDCCTLPALNQLAERCGPSLRLELLDQYLPMPQLAGDQRAPELRRRARPDEAARARDHAEAIGFTLSEPQPKPFEVGGEDASRGGEGGLRIHVSADGEVVIEHLEPGLVQLVRSLDPEAAESRWGSGSKTPSKNNQDASRSAEEEGLDEVAEGVEDDARP